jgi:hypothetical protein
VGCRSWPFGRRPSALRAECCSRGGCAVSTGDEKRLPPLEAAVNGQDRSRIGRASHHHHADHHVMARTGSARRHRQGPQAARERGRSEATSLARCRAQIEHRLRDGRCTHRSHARWHAVHPKANGDRTSPQAPQSATTSAAERVPFSDSDFRTNGTRLSGRNASPSVTHLSHRSPRDWTPNSASSTATSTPTAMA